ncbi:hypothetical protein ACFY41_08445 [Streptomyces syringium]|uniref:hypothetical protein n=1 Tax=Streptomyces syringium TaxID=76729 RepID=UPI00367AF6CE
MAVPPAPPAPGRPGVPAPAPPPELTPIGGKPSRPAPATTPPPSTPRPVPPVRSRPHRRPAYRSSLTSQGEQPPRTTSLVTLTLVMTVPAIMAAALLRPRSGGRRGR